MNRIGLSAVGSAAWDKLFTSPIAHRGLWSSRGAPENSLAAFEAACAAGYGIELDVRLSSDDEVVVFHDAHLARMTGTSAKLCEKSAAALAALRLANSAEPIPTLRQVLDLVAGRALILVEIKASPGEEGPLDRRVAEVIAGYDGPLAVIGFNPWSHAWWAQNRPEVLRGLDSYGYDDEAAKSMPEDRRRAFQALEHVAVAKPHFLALSSDMLTADATLRLRAEGYPVVAWTVRSGSEQEAVAAHCDNLIFEGFSP